MVPRDLRWDLKQWPIIEEAAPWLSATGEGCILAKAAVPAHIPPRHAHLRDLVDSSDTDCFPDKASIPLLCFKHTLECLSSRASHFSLSHGKHFLKLTQEEEHSGVGGGCLGGAQLRSPSQRTCSPEGTWQAASSCCKFRSAVVFTPSPCSARDSPFNVKAGLPWWLSGEESACQGGRHRFHPWSGKIPRAAEQLSPCATTTEPVL